MPPNERPPAPIAAVVRDLMETAGTTALALAEATGIPRSTLRRRLNDGDFTISELDSVSRALGSTPATVVALGESRAA